MCIYIYRFTGFLSLQVQAPTGNIEKYYPSVIEFELEGLFQ